MQDLKVIVLAGTFGGNLVREVVTDTTRYSKQQATISGLKRTVLHGPTGHERINPLLVPVHAKKSAEYIVRALEGIRRLHPLAKNVYFVVNEPDMELFHGTDYGTLFSEISGMSCHYRYGYEDRYGMHSLFMWY